MTSKLVKKTAKELAGAFFGNEDTFRDGRVMRTDRFRAANISEKQFVDAYWTDFVVIARKTLAHILTLPGTTQIQKDAIFDALLEERGQLNDEQKAAPSIMRLN